MLHHDGLSYSRGRFAFHPADAGHQPGADGREHRDDIKRWWEVVDRTASRVVPPQDWSYDEKSGNE